MIEVSNGRITLRVSKSAYKETFADRGFEPVNMREITGGYEGVGMHSKSKMPHLDDSIQQEYPEDEGESEEDETDLSEIPLGEMSFDQLCEYADQLELDHDGIRSKRELRSMIREHLSE